MTNLVLYDTLSQQKRPFVPINAGKVGLYVCGMTVYDDCHIGHARVMVAFDVIARWLAQSGFLVDYVRNITDVDDKIIQRAAKNGEPIGKLTARYIKSMHEDADALGCLRPNAEPRATDYIGQMQAMISTLIDKKHAYQGAGGDVYFAVDSFVDYGKLSKRHLNEMKAGARVETASDKKNPLDFVLWKHIDNLDEQGDNAWSAPFGRGRPGWHIECSAMSTCCLGDHFDIHGGGFDLQFPHHENEIAQSEAATGQTYANNWLHVGFVNVDGEKMSKSLGNFFTIKEILAKFHPEVVRFFIIQSHYRSPINFSDAALKEAQNGLNRLYQALAQLENQVDQQASQTANCADVWQSTHGKAFSAAMDDDFNTPKALSVLFGAASALNRAIKDGDDVAATEHAHALKTLAAVLNLAQLPPNDYFTYQAGAKTDGLSEADIVAQIDARAAAKTARDFATADAIRAKLLAAGVELLDSKDGTSWRRVQKDV